MLDMNEGTKTVVACLLFRIAITMPCTSEEQSLVTISSQPPMTTISSQHLPWNLPPIHLSQTYIKISISSLI